MVVFDGDGVVGDSDVEVGFFPSVKMGPSSYDSISIEDSIFSLGRTVCKDMRLVTIYSSFCSGHRVVNLIVMHVHRVES